jgi:hypothetical protein
VITPGLAAGPTSADSTYDGNASVSDNRLPGHESAGTRGKKYGDTANIIRFTEAS